MLNLNHIYFSFSETSLFTDFNMSFKRGLSYSIVGESGVGKSTLISLITGENQIQKGTMTLDGNDISKVKINKRPIGMMFQYESLFPHLNVIENILFPIKTKMHKTRFKDANIRELAIEKLKEVGLDGFQERAIETLSGGQKQRVAIARTLIIKPEILLLDEPFSALDEALKYELNTLIEKLVKRENIIAIKITHDLSEALSFSDEVLLLSKENTSFKIKPDELYTRAQAKEVCQFFKLGLCLDKEYIPSDKLSHSSNDMVHNLMVKNYKKLGIFHHYMLEFNGQNFNFVTDHNFEHNQKITLYSHPKDYIPYPN